MSRAAAVTIRPFSVFLGLWQRFRALVEMPCHLMDLKISQKANGSLKVHRIAGLGYTFTSIIPIGLIR